MSQNTALSSPESEPFSSSSNGGQCYMNVEQSDTTNSYRLSRTLGTDKVAVKSNILFPLSHMPGVTFCLAQTLLHVITKPYLQVLLTQFPWHAM